MRIAKMIRDKIQSKVAKAFDSKLADAVKSFTCSKTITSGAFDYEKQTYPTETIQAYSGRGVVGSYRESMVKPSDYQATDAKLTALQNEVIDSSGQQYKPEIDDILVFSDGAFRVVDVPQDPANATWSLQLRQATN